MKQLTPRWIALVVITALTLYVAWLVVSPFINVVLWAIVISVIAAPLNNALRRRWNAPNLCAAFTLAVVVVVLVLPMTFVVTTLVGKVDETVGTLQAALTKLTDPSSERMIRLGRYLDLNQVRTALGASTQPTTQAAIEGGSVEPARLQLGGLAGALRQYSGAIAAKTATILSVGVLAAAQFLLVLFTSYYLLRDGGSLMRGIREMMPLSKQQADAMLANIETIIAASLKGTVLIAAIQAILGGLAFWALGLPSALLWGIVMFFVAMIPVVGSSIVWGPAALYLLLTGDWIRAVILVGWGAGVIATVDNLLRPVLVGSKTRMHELTVFFSVLGGLQVFGPVGIIIGPIVIALAVGLLKIFQEIDGQPVVVTGAQSAPGPNEQPQIGI